VVAAEGNFSDDLAHPTMDLQSPDNTTPVPREVTNACAVVPVEVPGVIGVTANGNLQLKSFYSSYGVGSADVVAPGRGLSPAADGRGPERAGAFDLARIVAHRHLRGCTASRRRERGDVLLPAGNVDGLAACGRGRGADRKPVREDGS